MFILFDPIDFNFRVAVIYSTSFDSLKLFLPYSNCTHRLTFTLLSCNVMQSGVNLRSIKYYSEQRLRATYANEYGRCK